MNKDFYFNFSVSTKQYDRNKDDAAFLQWKEVNGNITTLSDYITEGFAYCNTFYHNEGTTFSNKFKSDNNAKSANLICLDLDAVKYPYNDFVTLMEKTEIKPNIVYSTANNGKFKKDTETYNNRYRVIYVVDEPIYNNALYKDIHQALKNEIRIITEDDNVFNDNTDNNISHFFAGSKNTNITTDENIYPLSWLMQRYDISSENEKVQCGCIYMDNGKSITRCNNKGTKYHADVYIPQSDNHFHNKDSKRKEYTYITDLYNKKLNDIKSITRNNNREREESIIKSFDTFSEEEKTFIENFYNMSFHELIHKYITIYPSIECTQLEYDDTQEIITLPSDYTEIKRRWYKEEVEKENGQTYILSNIHKTRNGEGRRNLLFKNLLLRKRILPNITFCHLLLNAVYEVHYFIINTDADDLITKNQIAQIAVNAYFAEDRMQEYKEKRKYKINEKFCAKHGISKKAQSIKILNERKDNEKRQKMEQIKKLYNPNLTDAQNLQLINNKGLNMSIATFKRYKKEMGLSKTPNKRHVNDNNTKDNKVIDQQIISAENAKEMPINGSFENAQETPCKDTAKQPQETPNKSVLSVSNVKGEQIPNEEELKAENVKETPKTYNNKYPHLVYINEMVNFENEMENANTIQELETLKNDFETILKGFPIVPKSAEKVVNNSLKSTMAKYNKILESMNNKA